MSDVEIAGWLRRETCDDLAFDGVLEDASVGGILLLKVESGREDGLFDELSGLVH